jgi:hypothetical protein
MKKSKKPRTPKVSKPKTVMRTVGRGLEDLAKLPWIVNGEVMEEPDNGED